MIADDLVLAINTGSSSIKLGLYRLHHLERPVLRASLSGIGGARTLLKLTQEDGAEEVHDHPAHKHHAAAFTGLLAPLVQRFAMRIVAVGHRIVHGGLHLRDHQIFTDAVAAELRKAVHLAPLHIARALELYEQSRAVLPRASQVACFDTAFHATMPATAVQLPIPKEFRDLGAIRFGFHGISCESVLYALRGQTPPRLVVCHLGSGSSITAIRDGRSIYNSMGLTPTGGLVMATRTGDLDPGVLLFLLRQPGITVDRLETVLSNESGLKALSQKTSDMRTLLELESASDPEAHLAVNAFCESAQTQIAGAALRLGGIDLIVFTGGVGENSAAIRDRILGPLRAVGLVKSSGRVDAVQVVPADEERQLARICVRLLVA